MHLFLKHICMVKYTYKVSIWISYLQQQKVGFSTLLCTRLSQLPRGQWQILLASNKKTGQQWTVFTSHTPRFQILLARRHYPLLWRRGRGEQFLATGHILKPPSKCIFMLKLTLKRKMNLSIVMLFSWDYSCSIPVQSQHDLQIVITVAYSKTVGYVQRLSSKWVSWVCNYCAVRLHNLSVVQYIPFSQPLFNRFIDLKPLCLLAKIVHTDSFLTWQSNQ